MTEHNDSELSGEFPGEFPGGEIYGGFEPEVEQIRALTEQIQPVLVAGDRRWRDMFARAEALAAGLTDPASVDDARTRLSVLTQYVRQLDGDLDGAAQALRDGLDAVERQRNRVDAAQRSGTWPPAQIAHARARLNDHEWTCQFTLAQLAQLRGDVAEGILAADACVRLGPQSLHPERYERYGVLVRAGLAFVAEDYPGAREGYARAVELFRAAEPERLGGVLIGLAQAEMMLGLFPQASRTLDRAEPLIGEDADAWANSAQARAFIAAHHRTGAHHGSGALDEEHVAEAARLRRDYAATTTEAEVSWTHQVEGAKSEAAALHLTDQVDEAAARSEELIAQARAHGDPVGLTATLAQASTALQDAALAAWAAGDLDGAERLHLAALVRIDEARELAQERGRDQAAASYTVTSADFVLQWYPEVTDAVVAEELRDALDRCVPAMRLLRQRSLAAATAADRRDFANLHARHGFEVACQLAFRLGERAVLAELIAERAAGYDWRAGRAAAG